MHIIREDSINKYIFIDRSIGKPAHVGMKSVFGDKTIIIIIKPAPHAGRATTRYKNKMTQTLASLQLTTMVGLRSPLSPWRSMIIIQGGEVTK